jgi:hypothetical protein
MDVVTNQGRTTRWLRRALGGALLASGMTALAAPPQERAAILLPPVKMEPGELPTLARGAIDDLPVGSTPVVRKAAPAGGPAWVSGVDPNVIPAAGFTPFRDKTETKTPILHNAKDLPPLTSSKLNANVPPPPPQSRPLEKPKASSSTERLIPPLLSTPEQPGDPNMPLRGTASNGAPVLAGPPAYRWYGYGTATPGANQFAPNGQYPKASANWYGVTGATPGAFPVPVVNPYRGTPGNEPPSYVVNPPGRTIEMPKSTPIAVPPSPSAPTVRPNPVSRPAPTPQTGVPAMPPIGSIGASPSTPLPPLPTPVGVPAMPPVSPVKMTKPASPEPLPPTLRNDVSMPVPVLPPPNLFSEPGANLIRNEITARAQMPDGKQPDATASLIHGLCKGRADGVDVRWNSSRKLTVCFEVRTAPDATKLVKDISARPELAPFAIDFCVLVK